MFYSRVEQSEVSSETHLFNIENGAAVTQLALLLLHPGLVHPT